MGKEKNILVLNYEFPPLGGGAANATEHLLREYEKDTSLYIDLVTSSTGKERVEKFSENITIHYIDIGKNGSAHYQSNKELLTYGWKSYQYAKKLMRHKTYSVCHAFFGIPSGFVAMFLGIPYIVSLRGSDVPFYNKRFRLLDTILFQHISRVVWKRAKAVVANSEALCALAYTTLPQQKISIIHNGVDTNTFVPAKKTAEDKIIRIISTGRLIERKGYHFLIDALKGVENAQLILIGDGPEKDALAEKARAFSVAVSFEGKRDRSFIISALQKADIFVLPSQNEGMSNSVLEAMACGLPIVATDTGGTKELISEGENGMIVPVGEVASLKVALLSLCNDKKLREKMGNASRSRAEKMSWQKMAKEYKKLYEF